MKDCKKALTALGVTASLVTGVLLYLNNQKDYLTYEEYLEIIKTYNAKLVEIQKDCEIDTRCIDGKVTLEGISNKKEVVKKLNQWILEDSEDPSGYKK